MLAFSDSPLNRLYLKCIQYEFLVIKNINFKSIIGMSSRSRSRSRSRGRRRSRSRSRSASERYSKFVNETELSAFKKILKEQEEHLCELMVEHKEEVEGLVEEKPNFKNKALSKQFEFNTCIEKELRKVKKLLKKGKEEKALKTLDSVLDKLEEKGEDLQIADSSPHGWLAVSVLRGRSQLPKDLQKKLDKVNSRLDRNRPYSKPKNGGDYSGDKRMDYKTGVRTDRRNYRQTPQELLVSLGNQKKAGNCSHCSEAGHFYRECPKFWAAVAESRKSNTTQKEEKDP